MDGKGQPLLAGPLKDEQGAPGASHLNDPRPESFPDPGADMPDVDAGRDFQQPLSEVAAQSFRARCQNDDCH